MSNETRLDLEVCKSILNQQPPQFILSDAGQAFYKLIKEVERLRADITQQCITDVEYLEVRNKILGKENARLRSRVNFVKERCEEINEIIAKHEAASKDFIKSNL